MEKGATPALVVATRSAKHRRSPGTDATSSGDAACASGRGGWAEGGGSHGRLRGCQGSLASWPRRRMTGSTQLSMLLAIAAEEEAMEVAKLRELEELNRLGRLNDGTNLTQLLGRACGWAGDEGEEGGAEEEEEEEAGQEEEGDASVSGCRLRSTGLVFLLAAMFPYPVQCLVRQRIPVHTTVYGSCAIRTGKTGLHVLLHLAVTVQC